MTRRTISDDPTAVAQNWVDALRERLDADDSRGASELFAVDAAWRDLLAFSWSIETINTRSGIEQAWRGWLPGVAPADVSLARDTPPSIVARVGRVCIEAFLSLSTRFGTGRGVVRLIEMDGRYLAWTLSTTLQALTVFEERSDARRPIGTEYDEVLPGGNWLDARQYLSSYEDREPDVLIVGGGQAGLAVAARLGQLSVDTLVIDRWPRIGDNWRRRYGSLKLHHASWTSHLPYLSFPDTWPMFIPKDMLANWLEIYVEVMQINYWTGTELLGGQYDDNEGRWTAEVRRADGEVRTLCPRHIVMATGVSGAPYQPDLPGLSSFKGTALHTSEYEGPESLGERVAIVGTGTSAHDVAQDLHKYGTQVTMLQRGPTVVVSLDPSSALPLKIYEGGLALETIDLIGISTPYPYSLQSAQQFTKQMRELDADLIAGLNRVGFRTHYGDDEAGVLTIYSRRGGGYYLNIGCSDLIICGEVSVRPWSNVIGFTKTGIAFDDESELELDAVVLATGYQPMNVELAQYFGSEVAASIGDVWGMDDSGELNNVWKPTAHPGLWFAAGSLIQCRVLSRYLALRIKADLEGLCARLGATD